MKVYNYFKSFLLLLNIYLGCPSGWIEDDIHMYLCYQKQSGNATFANASAKCQSMGATLPIFYSVSENDYFYNMTV